MGGGKNCSTLQGVNVLSHAHVPFLHLNHSLGHHSFTGSWCSHSSLTGLWTAGVEEPEQLWSWWKGSDPAAYPAGRKPHRELCPSHAPPPPSFPVLEGELRCHYHLNVCACSCDYTRVLQEFHLLPFCVVWVFFQWDGVWAYHLGSCDDECQWNLP